MDNWIESTLATHYDLLCERSGMIKNAKSAQMLGFFAAALLQGFVCDKFGCRTGILAFCVLSSIVSLLSGLLQTTSYYAFIILQILLITCVNSAAFCQFTYGVEIIGPRYRALFGMLSQCHFSLGFMLLTPVAMMVNTSSQIMLVGAIAPLCIFAILPFMRESFRWQLVKGKHAEGVATLKHYLVKSGVSDFDSNELEQLTATSNDDDKVKEEKMSDAVKSGALLRVSLKVAFLWLVAAMTYFKLAIGESSGDMLIDNVLAALVEIAFLVPGAFILQAKWCRRRWYLMLSYFVSGLSAALDAYFSTMAKSNPDDQDFYYNCARFSRLPGRGAITVAFCSLFVYTCEVYPTSIRASGLGFCSFCSRFGALLAPQIDRLSEAGVLWGPGAIISTLAFASVAVSYVDIALTFTTFLS